MTTSIQEKLLSSLLLLFLFLFQACAKEEDTLNSASDLPLKTTQAFDKRIEPGSAVSFRRDIYMVGYNAVRNKESIYIYSHDYNNIKDGFPLLKQKQRLEIESFQSLNAPSLVTWGDRLFCVYRMSDLYTNNYNVAYEIIPGSEENPAAKLSEQHESFLPTKFNSFTLFSLAEMDGYLYAAILNNERNNGDNGKIAMFRTTTTEPSMRPSWTYLGFIHNSETNTDAVFDIGANFKLRTATVFENSGMVSRLYLCVQKSKTHLEVYSNSMEENEKWKFFQTEMSSELSGVGTFDVVQGAIHEAGQDLNKIPLQLICSKGDYIVSQPFYPEDGGSWGPITYLKNHNGSVVATMGVTTNSNNSRYYTHLYTFVGNVTIDEKMDVDRYQSNTIQVESIHKSLLSEWRTDSVFRSMCTLIGIIEGPPPTLLTNEADFETLTSFYYPQLILRSSSIESCEFSHGFSGGVSVYAGYGYDNTQTSDGKSKPGCTFAVKLGLNFDYEYENKEEKMVHVDKELIFNTSYEARKYAYLVYVVPNVITKALYMSKPMSPENLNTNLNSVINSDMIWKDAFNYEIKHEDVNLVYQKFDITSSPFDIKNPNNLSSWEDRLENDWDNGYRTPLRGTQVSLDGADASVTIGGSASITNTHNWDLGFNFNADVAYKLGKSTFSGGSAINGYYNGGKTTKNVLSTDIMMKYPMIESKGLIDTTVKSFFSSFTIAYDKRSSAAIKYYEPLIKLKYMLKNEEPWVLQYQVVIDK